MGKPRKPKLLAVVTGAALINPGRYKGRVAPSGAPPIGDPPDWMSRAQKAAWRAFLRELPWLTGRHRAILELAAVARVQASGGGGVAVQQAYSSILSKLGATPVDCWKVSAEAEEEDPDEGLFTRG